jgi:hypothetical protein
MRKLIIVALAITAMPVTAALASSGGFTRATVDPAWTEGSFAAPSPGTNAPETTQAEIAIGRRSSRTSPVRLTTPVAATKQSTRTRIPRSSGAAASRQRIPPSPSTRRTFRSSMVCTDSGFACQCSGTATTRTRYASPKLQFSVMTPAPVRSRITSPRVQSLQ